MKPDSHIQARRKGSLGKIGIPPDAHIDEVQAGLDDNERRTNERQVRNETALKSRPLTSNVPDKRVRAK